MKTRKNPPVISSSNVLNFRFPKSWPELSQKQLRSVLVFLSAYPQLTALVKIACYFANLVIVDKLKQGVFCCRLVADDGMHTVNISSTEMTAMVDALGWVMEPGKAPVILEEVGGNKVVLDVELHSVPFETYLMLENLFQGYLMSNNVQAVVDMARLVYSVKGDFELKEFEVFSICQWFVQLKALLSERFPNFYKPAGSAQAIDLVDIMHAEIRALTGGDITKTSQVLEADTWVALAELDAKAREAEDFRKSLNK